MENTLQSTETQIHTTQNQLITLVDEAPVSPGLIPFSDACGSATTVETREHSIVDFLGREVILKSGTITTAIKQGGEVASVSLPSDYLKNAIVAPKVDGFRFIRGTFEIRVVVNAQPFQAGILRLLYFPVFSNDSAFNSQLSSMMQMSGLVGVDVNFEDKEPLVLEVPYIYPLPSFDMLVMPDDYAKVVLIVYSSVSVGVVNYTIFGRFKDVDISMPISAVIPSTREYYHSYLQQQMWSSDSEEEVFRRIPLPRSRWQVFMGLLMLLWCYITRQRRPRYSLQQQIGGEEQATRSGNTLSNIARRAGQAALSLAGIPFLTSIMTPISIASNTIANIAYSFGFASPRNEQVQTVIRPSIVYGMNNFNRTDVSHQLALDGLNKIDIAHVCTGTHLDEMSFKSIWMVPQFFESFKVTAATAIDSRVFDIDVTPYLTIPYGSEKMNITNMAYIATAFNLYRGSIIYNFKIAKTNFHSMRLAIVYFNASTADGSYSQRTPMNYSVIWDIRESYQQTITIPYIQANEWLYTSGDRSSLGRLAVYVLNPLQTGGTAVSSVEVLVEACAGYDFKVAVPRIPGIEGVVFRPDIGTSSNDEGQIHAEITPNGVQATIPWYADSNTQLDETGKVAVPNYLRTENVDGVIKKLNVVEKADDLVIETLTTDNKKQDLLVKNNYLFTWQSTGKLTANDVRNHFGDVYDLYQIGKLAPNGLTRVKFLLSVTSEAYSELKFALLDHVSFYFARHETITKHKISLKKKTRLWFADYSVFNISDVYVYITWIGDNFRLTLTNEHGPENDINIIFSVMGKPRGVQQISYKELMEQSTINNITGRPVILPDINATTVGEDIQSIRQLCSRYSLFKSITALVVGEKTTPPFLREGTLITFDPFLMKSEFTDGVDYISYFAPLYRFYSGELRYKLVMHRAGKLVDEYIEIRLLTKDTHDKDVKLKNNVSSTVLFVGKIEGIAEFTVPFYNRNNKAVMGGTASYLLSKLPLKVQIFCYSKTTWVAELYRAIGDNFVMCTRLSAPTMTFTNLS